MKSIIFTLICVLFSSLSIADEYNNNWILENHPEIVRENDMIELVLYPGSLQTPDNMSNLYLTPNDILQFTSGEWADSAVVDGDVVNGAHPAISDITIDPELAALFVTYGVTQFGRTIGAISTSLGDDFVVPDDNGNIISVGFSNIYRILFDDSFDVDEVKAAFAAADCVEEANYWPVINYFDDTPTGDHNCNYNDILIDDQWYLEFIEDSIWGIDAFGGWDVACDYMYRDKKVVLAIVDGGFGWEPHPDWINNVNPESKMFYDSPDIDSSDFHGTVVTGVAGASAWNFYERQSTSLTVPQGIGIVGVAPTVDLMLLNHSNTYIDRTSNALQRLYYILDTANVKVDVINMSWGITTNIRTLSYLMRTAYFVRDISLVASAGNCDCFQLCPYKTWPAEFPWVISVAATNIHGDRAEFSNWKKVDLAAPGEDILTTGPVDIECLPTDSTVPAPPRDQANGYSSHDGTSLSSPLVAAIVANLKYMRPDLSSASIFELLKETTVIKEPRDEKLGHGIVNFANAARRARELGHCYDIMGDVDVDCYINSGDFVFLMQYLFLGGPEPVVPRLADVNGDCTIDVGDLTHLLHFIQYGTELTEGCADLVMEPDETDDQHNVVLHQNYPNPFNPETVIRFFLREKSEWSLEVYNVTGQTVRTWNGISTGYVNIEFNASDLASGVYFYKLHTGDVQFSRKMLMLK